MYVTRTEPLLQQARNSAGVSRRAKSTFQGVLEVEQLSEDAVSAGGNAGEDAPEGEHQHGTPPGQQKQQHPVLDVKV